MKIFTESGGTVFLGGGSGPVDDRVTSANSLSYLSV